MKLKEFDSQAVRQQPVPQVRGPYKKSAETRAAIVQAAIDLLIEGGYQHFSLRKVALRAGVSIGNLQHHFTSKENLISQMLDVVITGYLEEFENLISASDSPKEQLRSVVKQVVEDLGTRETTMFFPELWSLANHDPAALDSMHAMYGRYQEIYHRIIKAINPGLSERQIKRAGLFFVSALEGHTMFIGHGKPANDQIDAITEIAYSSFLRIIETGEIPD